jgi:hypothetical protein
MGGRINTKRFGLGELTGSRLIPYMIPWLLCALAMPVALLARWRWGGDPIMSATMGAGAMFLVGVTYVTWGKRHEQTRNIASLFAAVLLGWFVFAVSSDPLANGMVDAWLFGSALVSLAWDIRYASLSVPHEDDKPEGDKDPLFGKIKSLTGARTKKMKVSKDGGRLDASVQLKPGEHTVSEVQGDRERMAQIVGMGTEDITVSTVPGHADHVTLSFTFGNGLRRSIYWPGPSLVGGSVYDAPLRPGIRADGKDLALWLCGDSSVDPPRQLSHCLASGATGSGKTETVKTIILDGRWRRDFVPVVGDPAKFNQTFGEIKDGLALVADTKEKCERLVRNLQDAIKYRAYMFGDLTRSDGTQGYSQWEPELWTLHGIPLVFIDLEEAADLVDADMDDPVRKARSVGIFLWVSLQTAIFANLERKTRGQFAQSACHGMNEMQDAKFGLSAHTINAGADPTKWGNESAGSLYAEFSGTPKNEWSVESRAFSWGRNESEARAARRADMAASREAGFHAEMDSGTYAYLAQGIEQPGAQTDAVTAPEQPEQVEQAPAEQPVEQAQTITSNEGDDMGQQIAPPRHAGSFSLGIPGGSDDGMSVEEARAKIEARVDSLEAAGQDSIGYKDLADLASVVGRKRAWIYKELNRLVASGRLQEGNKPPYRINPRITNGHRQEARV